MPIRSFHNPADCEEAELFLRRKSFSRRLVSHNGVFSPRCRKVGDTVIFLTEVPKSGLMIFHVSGWERFPRPVPPRPNAFLVTSVRKITVSPTFLHRGLNTP